MPCRVNSPPPGDPKLAVFQFSLLFLTVIQFPSLSHCQGLLCSAARNLSLIEIPTSDLRGQWDPKVSPLPLGDLELAGGDLMTLECMDLVVALGLLKERACHVPLGLGSSPLLDEAPCLNSQNQFQL